MALILSGITLPFTVPPEQAVEQAKRMLGDIRCTKSSIAKRSVDARHKDRINFVYSVALEVEGDEDALAEGLANPKLTVKKNQTLETPRGARRLNSPPVIAGFGPAGMFAGLLLAREGYRPIILDRGKDVDTRVKDVEHFWATGRLDPESNVQFGEGGAGTFSDGKLTTRIGDPRCGFVLRELARHGAPEEILWNAKPHVGTDRLRQVVRSIREEIIALGGEVRFGEKLDGLSLGAGGQIRSVRSGCGERADQVLVLAPGHSARDTFRMLRAAGVALEAKPFSVGVRIEHLQADIDAMLYGSNAGHPLLPHGEYQLSHRENGRAVYTFCMCPGGVVVPASSGEGMVVTNGMSAYARDNHNANSALVVSVSTGDFGPDALDGVAFQEGLERAAFSAGGGGYAAPAQTVDHFLAGRGGYTPGRVTPSYARGVTGGDLARLLPPPVADMLKTGLSVFQRKLRGFGQGDGVLTGLETRTSSPVRILRGEEMQAVRTPGLYPCGEGAGYAGGIVSAAVDGLRAAQAVIGEYAP